MSAATSEFPPVRACLFDMDGLLIDSEDLYTLCTNAVLRKYGKPDLPWSIKAQLQGRPGPEAGRIFRAWAQLPITSDEFMDQQTVLQEEHFPKARPLPGVPELLANLDSTQKSSPRRPTHIALATSSKQSNFTLKTTHISDLFDRHFPNDRRILGDDPRIPKGRGKPAPDIYLMALRLLNESIRRTWEENGRVGEPEPEITPEECLVFEDSVPGVEAGRRAGMRVIWCPHPGLLNEYRGREGQVLAGLTGEYKEDDATQSAPAALGVNGNTSDDLLSGNPAQAERSGIKSSSVHGTPGEVDDGWGELLETLVNFPYEKYGIHVQKKST
ncbi:HAD-like protein [Xylona heveae TC161]|uniref:HAD-like protein n=1 Tax=Xylona heveae (strain CBS 132557 / TC161) TaxID=1328760 RepID=A0A164ZNQ8_XYLHT|nr:HAD-like protein [Xylona heveae TC161]KZF19318.1 HAD-like protein [Xylona heveae TC161]